MNLNEILQEAQARYENALRDFSIVQYKVDFLKGNKHILKRIFDLQNVPELNHDEFFYDKSSDILDYLGFVEEGYTSMHNSEGEPSNMAAIWSGLVLAERVKGSNQIVKFGKLSLSGQGLKINREYKEAKSTDKF